MEHIVVIVPGLMGSVLKLNAEVIWPGSITELVYPYQRTAQLLREDLVATDCVRSYSVKNLYGQLIHDLAAWGFSEAGGTLVIAAYDWRRDIAHSAETLARYVDNAVASKDADSEVSLLGHSLGGLVCRYYLESGQFDRSSGFRHISQMISLGTPHHGAPLAICAILGQEKTHFLSRDEVHRFANDTRYPVLYQILPPQEEPFLWNSSVGKRLIHLDIYDPDIAGKLGLERQNLIAAQKFHSTLNQGQRPTNVRYFCFAGTGHTTTARLMVRPFGAELSEPVRIEEASGGDGTVPIWSGFLRGSQRMFVHGAHDTIYRNRGLRRALAALLGVEGYLAGELPEIEVSIRETVVEPQDLVHVAITSRDETGDLIGTLTVERGQIDDKAGTVTNYSPFASYPVESRGLAQGIVSLVFNAPNIRGIYRLAFCGEQGQLSAFDELFVQQPSQL